MNTQIKYALFDLDGVVITARARYFSEQFADEQGIDPEAVQEFFRNEFKKCLFGRTDLKEVIAPYLPQWNWKGTVDELLEHWFASESTKDEAVLEVLKQLRAAGIKCYIATRQEKYRMRYLEEVVGLKEHFDGTFVTHEIGHDKSDPAFFEHVLNELEAKPEEVLFFDDTQKNIDTALEMDIPAYFYDKKATLDNAVASLIGAA
jgi:putative hydrolase of the HAD superfamily